MWALQLPTKQHRSKPGGHMDGMVVGVLLGAILMLAGIGVGTWLAARAQDDRDMLEFQLGQTIADQQHEIMRLRSGEADAKDLGYE